MRNASHSAPGEGETSLLSGFSDLDRHFARVVGELSPPASDALRLAAALASHQRAAGHACLDLGAVAGCWLRDVASDLEDSPMRLPALAAWRKVLRASSAVGQPGDFTPLVLDGADRLYLHRYWRYETDLAAAIRQRAQLRVAVDEAQLEASLQRLFPQSGEGFDGQRHAVRTAATRAFSVITGGPGTGKTRTVVWLLAALLEQAGERPLRIALTAPTGKSAARIAESVRAAKAQLPCSDALKARLPEEATTIHRLLGAIRNSPRFRHDAANPLAVDIVVVDEASMADLALMAKLFAALPSAARVVLIGDKDQLASVEAGNVLGEICAGAEDGSETASPLADCVTELRKNWRFAADAEISLLSRAVNTGDADTAMARLRTSPTLWRTLPRPEELPSALRERILTGYGDVMRERNPAMALLNRFRLLAAVRRGPYGVESLNPLIEALLEREGLITRRGPWYAGRPVIVTRNDPATKLFNGDVGIALPDAGGNLRVFFPGAGEAEGVRGFAPARLPEHETVFAMTIHKSQGSEFDRVLLVLPERDSPLLTRELIYTGLTRAKSAVELWADEVVLRAAIGRRVQRASGLRDALWNSVATCAASPP
ncbi:MAG TPA: exodeoxyribonuclease V subunit alpha [Candidatus Limnocylindria bacterium]|jgi:exodeoxyribonuclease V alpha subunit|nr:exodeoxyribonuclease V subunit alpha [Candidatus Limnocylindria bacterium]